MAEKNLKIGKGSETGVKSGDGLRGERLDMFAGQHISLKDPEKMDKETVLKVEKRFLKFCEVECGWYSYQILDHESMKNALREFVRRNQDVYRYVTIEN